MKGLGQLRALVDGADGLAVGVTCRVRAHGVCGVLCRCEHARPSAGSVRMRVEATHRAAERAGERRIGRALTGAARAARGTAKRAARKQRARRPSVRRPILTSGGPSSSVQPLHDTHTALPPHVQVHRIR